MKALELLEDLKEHPNRRFLDSSLNEAIKELEELQENKLLIKMNEEMIELRKQNQDLLNTIIEAQEAITNILERNKWDVQIVKL